MDVKLPGGIDFPDERLCERALWDRDLEARDPDIVEWPLPMVALWSLQNLLLLPLWLYRMTAEWRWEAWKQRRTRPLVGPC